VKAQELAEEAALSEKALRPIVFLASPAEQMRLVHALAEGTLTLEVASASMEPEADLALPPS
jgi:hypothetical protein